MTQKYGIEGKSYFCAAGIGGTPTWSELDCIKNAALAIAGKEVDVTTRANAGFAATGVALLDAGVDFEIPLDEADTGYQALETAFFAKSTIGIAVMSGGIAVAGSRGLWADCVVTKFDRDESAEDAQIVKVSVKPTKSANAPQWKIIAGS